MESERMWAQNQQPEPSETKYRNYHEAFLTDHEIERFTEQVRRLVTDLGDQAVAQKQPEIMQECLERYEAAARSGHRGFRWWGVAEAAAGAFAWTLLLIFISLVLKYVGIDAIEVFRRVMNH